MRVLDAEALRCIACDNRLAITGNRSLSYGINDQFSISVLRQSRECISPLADIFRPFECPGPFKSLIRLGGSLPIQLEFNAVRTDTILVILVVPELDDANLRQLRRMYVPKRSAVSHGPVRRNRIVTGKFILCHRVGDHFSIFILQQMFVECGVCSILVVCNNRHRLLNRLSVCKQMELRGKCLCRKPDTILVIRILPYLGDRNFRLLRFMGVGDGLTTLHGLVSRNGSVALDPVFLDGILDLDRTIGRLPIFRQILVRHCIGAVPVVGHDADSILHLDVVSQKFDHIREVRRTRADAITVIIIVPHLGDGDLRGFRNVFVGQGSLVLHGPVCGNDRIAGNHILLDGVGVFLSFRILRQTGPGDHKGAVILLSGNRCMTFDFGLTVHQMDL